MVDYYILKNSEIFYENLSQNATLNVYYNAA